MKFLLNQESHALNRGTSLLAKVYNANSRIAESKKIVYEQHMVISRQVLFVDDHIV